MQINTLIGLAMVYRCCVIVFWLMLAVITPGAIAETITFNNFSQQVQLVSAGDNHYRVKGRDLQVSLSNRLIVKTSMLTKSELLAIDSAIMETKLLFEMQQASYFLLQLTSINELSRLLKKLQDQPAITLVQPDMLQLQSRNDYAAPGAVKTGYFKQLKLTELWRKTLGKGVKVAIIDDGFDLTHPDLKRVNTSFQYDLHTQKLDASPRDAVDVHGTKVAGIIFAAHHDGPAWGVAPAAELIAIRHVDTWTSQTLLSFHLAKLAGADVINASWNSQWLLQPLAEVVDDLARHGRHGKGLPVVFAAGNQGADVAGLNTEAGIGRAIVVGAVNKQNKPASYSNYGNTVDVAINAGVSKTTIVSGGYGIFSGTSLSAAVISGYIALLLSLDDTLTLHGIVERLHEISPPIK